MRAACVGLLVVALIAGSPMRASARDTGREAALAGASVAANILYTPAKLLLALGGLPAGALTFVCTGGNARAAYAIWVPTVGGTYFLTPSRLDGIKPIHFIGRHYPSNLSPAVMNDEPCQHAKCHADEPCQHAKCHSDEPCEHAKGHSHCHESAQ